ncbi:hypothetical protein OESDEN_08694 [Oesophagostomum dentatum]|uniref:Uncharacterized protein n=1 Tax=Oesophagostomum dentatum TaxID=61180 RepID=A0A0B1T7S2_OESDE|nr:hypothetical protein OESDEN_08694 [Oesophagostomum dentatum]
MQSLLSRFYVILGVTVGVVAIIALSAILVPKIMNVRKERHKKWLEETWEERVRQAANDLNAQGGAKGFKENTRAGRKAMKGSAEGSKEPAGSKEGFGSKDFPAVEKGSKDDLSKDDQLFPAAIGPNEGRPSAEAAGGVGVGGPGHGFGGPEAKPGGPGAGFGGPGPGFPNAGPGYGGAGPGFGGNGPGFGGAGPGFGGAGTWIWWTWTRIWRWFWRKSGWRTKRRRWIWTA